MKILIITRSQWDDSNSIGNTLTNFFSNYPKENIANIYFRSALPNNNTCNIYYSISDKEVLKSIFNLQYLPGKAFLFDSSTDLNKTNTSKEESEEDKIYDYFRKNPSILTLWGQNLVWTLGRWRNRKLLNFLEEFKPDIIFTPCFHTNYTHKILWYIQKKTNAKVALFHADDYLSTKINHRSLIERINIKMRAKVVRTSALSADLNYCISQFMQEEYQTKIGKKMLLLYKGADFSAQPEYSIPKDNNTIRIIYIGSILYGRWKTLSVLVKEICKINKEKKRFELIIYSQYKLTQEMEENVIVDGVSIFKGKVLPIHIKKTLMSGDIVLHIESLDDIEKEKTRLSFSTKIVDCMNSGRAIIAIGWKKSASVNYLLENDAAMVAENEDEVAQILQDINNNPLIVSEYANKSWRCGKRNHQISKIQESLYQDLKSLVEEQK